MGCNNTSRYWSLILPGPCLTPKWHQQYRVEQVEGLEPSPKPWQGLVLATDTIPAYGASSLTRTDDLLITSELLYQLSYESIWSWQSESNQQPIAYKAIALPLCYTSIIITSYRDREFDFQHPNTVCKILQDTHHHKKVLPRTSR